MYLLFLRDSAFKKRMHFSLGTVLCLSQQWTSSSKNLHILGEIYYLLPVLIVPPSLMEVPTDCIPSIPCYLIIFFTVYSRKISKVLSILRAPKSLSKINLLLLCFVFCVQDQDQTITEAKYEFFHWATSRETQITFPSNFNAYMTFLL